MLILTISKFGTKTMISSALFYKELYYILPMLDYVKSTSICGKDKVFIVVFCEWCYLCQWISGRKKKKKKIHDDTTLINKVQEANMLKYMTRSTRLRNANFIEYWIAMASVRTLQLTTYNMSMNIVYAPVLEVSSNESN